MSIVGALVLARRRQGRWMAWWMALYFIPLGLVLLDHGSVAILGGLQAIVRVVLVLVLVPVIGRAEYRSACVVGPVLGFSLLAYAVVSAVFFVVSRGL